MASQPINGNANYADSKVDVKAIWDENPQPIKLFVGQLPNQFADHDLKTFFERFGEVVDAHVLTDKTSRLSKGCGFVGFANRESAEKAIAALHEKYCLQPGKRNLQVKFAGKEEAAKDSTDEWKLFVGMLAKTTDENRLRTIFEKHGPVKEVHVMRDGNQSSKGCAFVKYSTRDHAVAAISGLHEVFRDDGAPRNLTVKFAETKADRERILKRAPNMMHAYPMMNKFQGFNEYAHQQNPFVQANAMPMPANFVNPNMAMHSAMQNNVNRGGEIRGPPGANIFVYNVPDSFTDADLARMFSNCGMVISSKVYLDKMTGKPRGFGFVSYASPNEAEYAIQTFNNYDLGPKKLKVALKKPGMKGGFPTY